MARHSEVDWHPVPPRGSPSSPADPGPEAPDGGPVWRIWPVLAILGTGVALYAFFLYSEHVKITFGFFSHPPIYGLWGPRIAPLALWVLPTGLVLAALGWAYTSARRIPSWLALPVLIAAGVATSAAVNVVRGGTWGLVRGAQTSQKVPYVSSDVHFVYRYGVRGFVENFLALTSVFHSYNSRTHPPGVLVLLYALFRLLGRSDPARVATAIAVLGMLGAVAAWAIARALDNERSGRIAAVLFVASPGPLLLAYTNMDLVFAAAFGASIAMFLLAIRYHTTVWSSTAWAVGAGAVVGLATILTFATIFVVLAATIAVLIQVRGIGNMVRLLGSAAVGALAVLAAARIVTGLDMVAIYHHLPEVSKPYDPYWIVASPVAWLIYAGLPVAALGVAGLFIKVPGARRPILAGALALIMVVWGALPTGVTHLRPGEVERTWAFLFPVLAACAAPIVERWSRRAGRWSGAVIAALVLVSVAQAVLIQAFWDTLF